MTLATNFQQTQQQAAENDLHSTNPDSTTETNTRNPIDASDENEPLLAHLSETESHQNDIAHESEQRNTLFSCLLRYAIQVLYACLAFVCAALGLYILYILFHIPTIASLLRERRVEFGAASLIDISDSSVVLSVLLRFPDWSHHAVVLPFANVTIFHKGDAVGWLSASNIEIDNLKKTLELSELFHIVDQNAMGDLLRETAVSRQVVVDAKAVVDLSGVGRLLPTVTTRREIRFTLPTPPTVNYTIHDIEGPVTESGGISARALLRMAIPYNVSANIDKLCLDVCYTNVNIANVCVGPVSIDATGHGTIPVNAHILEISGPAHEYALANILRNGSAGNWPEFIVTGSNPSLYTGAPTWLRQALSNIIFPIKLTPPRIPHRYFPPLDGLFADTIVDELYAYWSANKSFHPWVGISARTTLSLPNPTKSNAFMEVQSLVPHLNLVDNALGAFAVVTTENFFFSTKQLSPLCFCVAGSCDRLGVDAIPGMEHVFAQTMKRFVISGKVDVTVNGTLDVAFQTSIGKLYVESMPFQIDIDKIIGRDSIDTLASSLSLLRLDETLPQRHYALGLGAIHISNTTQKHISIEVDLEVENPYSYGAHMSDIAIMLRYAGLHIATVGLREPTLNQGRNTITSYIDFYNHVSDTRQQMFFLQVSSGKNITIELSGFPNCTSIVPLEASLRDFAKEVVVDTSEFKSGGSVSSGIQSVLREVVFHAFDMAAEATVVNPVSGANIWLQSIEAVGYYDGDISLGAMDYDFTADHGFLSHTRGTIQQQPIKGLLLPFEMATTTPHMPVTANTTSIGWDVVRRAIGGTLEVDVFTNIQLLVGSAQLNLTLVGKKAPVKIRF